MKGCRPLSPSEHKSVLAACADARERALLVLGCATGYRISELLSLRVRDLVDPDGKPLRYISVAAGSTKTKEGRTIILAPAAGQVVAEYIAGLRVASDESPLFPGQHGKPLSRVQAWRIFKSLCSRAGVTGAIATHTLRKTFADRMYRALDGRIEKVQRAMGHRSITSTVAYLSFTDDEIDSAIAGQEL